MRVARGPRGGWPEEAAREFVEEDIALVVRVRAVLRCWSGRRRSGRSIGFVYGCRAEGLETVNEGESKVGRYVRSGETFAVLYVVDVNVDDGCCVVLSSCLCTA